MASIPLPALDVKPPAPQPGPLEQYAQIMGIRNAQQDQQLRAQQMQGVDQENQMRQMQLQDQQNLRSAAKGVDWSQSDAFDKFLTGAQSSGVSPQTLSQLSMQRQQYLKSVADTNVATNTANLANNNVLLGHIETLEGITDPAKRAAAAQTIGQQILSEGSTKNPQILQTAQAMAGGQLVPTDDQLDSFKAGLLDHKTVLSNALTAAQTGEANARAAESNANTQKINQEMQFGPTGPAAEGKYRFILGRIQSGIATPQDVAWAKSFEDAQTKRTNTSDSLGVVSSNTSAPAGVAAATRAAGAAQGAGRPLTSTNLPSSFAGSPANVKQNIVDEIGQYRMDPNLLGRTLYRHPEMLGLIQQKYPDWDQTEYQAKNKIVQSYTSGPESRSINAIGTALGHANELRDAIDALGNSDGGIKALRDIGNKIGVQVGSDAVTGFNLIVHRLAPEITAAYVQGGGGEGERVSAADDFNPSLGRKQLLTNWGETVKLLQSKVAQDKQQWDTTYRPNSPQDDFYTRFMSPVAKQAISRWSGETGNKSSIGNSPAATASLSVQAPNGKTYTFKDQASADAFRKSAGIK